MPKDDEDTKTYAVVVNQEEQYSIWPVGLEVPGGWRMTGPSGSKYECLDYITRVWTDMRPLSLRSETT
jgi:MbtH protein